MLEHLQDVRRALCPHLLERVPQELPGPLEVERIVRGVVELHHRHSAFGPRAASLAAQLIPEEVGQGDPQEVSQAPTAWAGSAEQVPHQDLGEDELLHQVLGLVERHGRLRREARDHGPAVPSEQLVEQAGSLGGLRGVQLVQGGPLRGGKLARVVHGATVALLLAGDNMTTPELAPRRIDLRRSRTPTPHHHPGGGCCRR